MAYKIVYRLDSKLNVKEAKEWYKLQRIGLEKDFAASVRNAINRIQMHPEAFAVRYRNVRIAHTNTFPFSIHFYIETSQQTIVITNILHDRRHFKAD